MDELTGEFVAETRETLERVAEALVGWETKPDDPARLDEIFRFVHTVKGSCGFLDLPRIGALAHAAETALAEVRDGRRVASPALVGVMLRIIDRVALLANALENGGDVPDEAADAPLIAQIDAPVAAEATAPAFDLPADPVAKTRNIRVSVELLESAMTQVSDLVLARNDLARRLRESTSDPALTAAFDRVSGAIGDVRESIARTRMQPIERLFAMLPRLVRDTATTVEKDVELQIEGSDVEIDREMIEAVRDPLTHIVRNAIDHGIERPDARRSAGKPDAGRLRVTARQSGNQVSITVSDDGRGIDTERLIEKALAANVISASKAASLSSEAAAQLIFAPGLSTAKTISEISGRGVGMDVVRANIERLGGAITLDNRPGVGLAITLRAPLTLSIMNALVIEAGGQTFALPRAAIDEIVSVKSESVRVESLGGGQVAVVRGKMLPVISLAMILGLEHTPPALLAITDIPGVGHFAIGLTHVRDHTEIVVRPTAPQLASIGVFAGQAIPDSGLPMLVIDPVGIALRAGIEGSERQAAALARYGAEEIVRDTVLTFEGLDGQQRAIRRTAVEHIDDVLAEDFVTHGAACFARLNNALIPVILDGTLPASGPVAMLRLSSNGVVMGLPVARVRDLSPMPTLSPVDDGIVEGIGLIGDVAVAVLAWPRADVAARNRSARA